MHAPRRRAAGCSVAERPEGRAAPGALRAARVAGRREPRSTRQQRNPVARCEGTRADNAYARSPGDPRLPVRAHDVPADRAPHRRRHVALAVAPRRAAAGALLRDLAGARGEIGVDNGGWVDGDDTARADRRARARHARACGRCRRRARTIHQVGLPYHFGGRGLVRGDVVNDLLGDLAGAERATSWNRRRSTGASGPGRTLEGGSLMAQASNGASLTDSTLCIGCKACEVACKEWNELPDDGFTFTGMSYDNTGGPRRTRRGGTSSSSSARDADAARRPDGGYRSNSFRWDSRPTSASTASTPAASRPARPARSSAPSSAASSSSRTSATAAATASSPARSASIDRRAGRRPGVQVHVLLRPAEGRAGAGLREGVPDRRRSSSASSTSSRPGPTRGSPSCTRAGSSAPTSTGRTRRAAGHRGAERVLPAPRQARGLQPAARPGGADDEGDRLVEGARLRGARDGRGRDRRGARGPHGGPMSQGRSRRPEAGVRRRARDRSGARRALRRGLRHSSCGRIGSASPIAECRRARRSRPARRRRTTASPRSSRTCGRATSRSTSTSAAPPGRSARSAPPRSCSEAESSISCAADRAGSGSEATCSPRGCSSPTSAGRRGF